MSEFEDPAATLDEEVRRTRRKAWFYVTAALLGLPAIGLAVYLTWQHMRVGLVGGLVIGLLLTHRTMKKAMAGGR